MWRGKSPYRGTILGAPAPGVPGMWPDILAASERVARMQLHDQGAHANTAKPDAAIVCPRCGAPVQERDLARTLTRHFECKACNTIFYGKPPWLWECLQPEVHLHPGQKGGR